MKDTGSKKTKKPDKELNDSEEILIHQHKGFQKKRPKNYCPVVTFDGKRPNPRYRPPPDQAAIKRKQEMDLMKAKLMGKR